MATQTMDCRPISPVKLVTLLVVLIHTVSSQHWPRFDGRFNNLVNPEWGSAGAKLVNRISNCYLDFTYLPPGVRRPNPRDVSNNVFRGSGGTVSANGRTALFAFFGQLVAYEILNTDDSTCPVEIISVPVPPGDPDFDPDNSEDKLLPYERKIYDKSSGQSPNNPRKQMNRASSFIDGSFIYSYSEIWANVLWDYDTGKLTSSDLFGKIPQRNILQLPFDTLPTAAGKYVDPESLWTLGDPRVQENPALLSLSLLFFRWHNKLVERFHKEQPSLSPYRLFYTARKWVVATLQKIILYDWVPKLLNLNETEVDKFIPLYGGYRSSIDPTATVIFDAAAMKYVLTLVPSQIIFRDLQHENCTAVSKVRLCNTYWNSQKYLEDREYGLEEILLGLASQPAEREDTEIVHDIRGKLYGPLHYSRHDDVVLTIVKGRDYGLCTYNEVREEMGLKKKVSLEDINPNLSAEVMNFLMEIFNGTTYMEQLDVFVGGMLETTEKGPGELFTTALLNQFTRLRDGDRFWFENEVNGLFTKEEIKEIRKLTLADIMKTVGLFPENRLQDDVFTLGDGRFCHFEPVNESVLEPCPQHKGYDYFHGSELAFVIIWAAVAILPILCGVLAYFIFRVKQMVALRVLKHARKIDSAKKLCQVAYGWITALEWLGEKQHSRNIEIQFHKQKNELWICTLKGSLLRTISFGNLSQWQVELWNSSNEGQTTLLIHLPREYDLVLVFPTIHDRTTFENDFRQLLDNCGTEIVVKSMKLKAIHKLATTKIQRNLKLEIFFKQVFSEALNMEDMPSQNGIFGGHMANVDCELNKDEFAEALGVKSDSDFLLRMFDLIDNDADGYISFKEFLATVVLFSKGSSADKLKMLFRMYSNHGNQDGSRTIGRQELTKLFKSLLDMAHSDVDMESVEKVVSDMCTECGVENTSCLGFSQFCQIFSPQLDSFSKVSLEWKGAEKHLNSDNNGRKAEKKSTNMSYRRNASSTSLSNLSKAARISTNYSSERGSGDSLDRMAPRPSLHVAFREKYTPLAAKAKVLKHFIQNNNQHIFYLVLFFGICLLVAADKFYYYSIEAEHGGFRKIAGLGISVARAGAGGVTFTFSLILLTMCRNTITWLRGTFLNLYAPFDSHVTFHKVVAWTALFFTACHVIGHGLNFYHISTQPTKFLCIFQTIVLRSDLDRGFTWWVFGTMTGFTGVLVTVFICIMYVFATQTARRFMFNEFWLTHKLYIPIYVLTILHGMVALLQKPGFFVYFVGPAILFTVDKIISLSRKTLAISVSRAEHLPSDVTMIEFKRPAKFEYKSGQWVRIACLAQGRNEYHPFTLTSAPHEYNLSIHVRALGPWSWNFRKIFDPENLKGQPYPKLFLDGPYGAGQQDWCQYDVSILVGAGIGVTPYASILKDFVHMSQTKITYKIRCQKLYFVWVTGSQRHYEWLIDILQQVEDVDTKGVVTIDIFITQFFQKFDLRTALLYICEEHFQKLSRGRSVFTGLKASTHFGRPQLSMMMGNVHKSHPQVRKVGVFSCGPPGLTKGVEKACMESSRQTKALFEHHFENF